MTSVTHFIKMHFTKKNLAKPPILTRQSTEESQNQLITVHLENCFNLKTVAKMADRKKSFKSEEITTLSIKTEMNKQVTLRIFVVMKKRKLGLVLLTIFSSFT